MGRGQWRQLETQTIRNILAPGTANGRTWVVWEAWNGWLLEVDCDLVIVSSCGSQSYSCRKACQRTQGGPVSDGWIFEVSWKVFLKSSVSCCLKNRQSWNSHYLQLSAVNHFSVRLWPWQKVDCVGKLATTSLMAPKPNFHQKRSQTLVVCWGSGPL